VKSRWFLTVAAAIVATSFAAPVAAKTPLSDQTYVVDRLMAARVAHRITKVCNAYSPRMVYAWGEARALKRWALSQGYTDAEIDAFLDDKAEKKRIYALAEDYLKAKGAVDEASFCALGRSEIDGRTYIGSFLND
jgi:hypothetical protein